MAAAVVWASRCCVAASWTWTSQPRSRLGAVGLSVLTQCSRSARGRHIACSCGDVSLFFFAKQPEVVFVHSTLTPPPSLYLPLPPPLALRGSYPGCTLSLHAQDAVLSARKTRGALSSGQLSKRTARLAAYFASRQATGDYGGFHASAFTGAARAPRAALGAGGSPERNNGNFLASASDPKATSGRTTKRPVWVPAPPPAAFFEEYVPFFTAIRSRCTDAPCLALAGI